MLMKYTLRNIFTKKGRLIILMLCIIVACFTANLALEFSGALREALASQMSGMYGNTDYRIISLNNLDPITEHTFDDCPVAVRYVIPQTISGRELRREEKMYMYALMETVSVYAFNDFQTAMDIGLFKGVTLPEVGEIAIGERYAKKYGYEVGDTIPIYNSEGEEFPLTVASTFKENTYLGGDNAGLYAVINFDQYLETMGESIGKNCFLQVVDKKQMKEFDQYLSTKHGLISRNLRVDESLQKLMNNITAVLYLIFAFVFILVIFVTVSFTEKIIIERMNVIGTLRSIGMSVSQTTWILLFENILYGLVGGIVAMVLYLLVRTAAGFLIPGFWDAIGAPNIAILLLVIAGAVLIEVLVPLKEVMNAAKTSIRDIIFESRDAEYRIHYPSTILGFVLIAAGTIAGLVTQNLIVAIFSLLLIIFGGGLCVRFVVRKITWALASFFERKNKPIAELAAKECGSKKPNSGNAVLAVSTICAATAIIVAGSTFIQGFGKMDYDADILIRDAGEKAKKYEFLTELEGVESAEYLYFTQEAVSLGGKDCLTDIWRIPEGDAYLPLREADKNLAVDEIILDATNAHRAHVKAGDTIKVVFHSQGIFPVEKELKVKQVITINSFNFMGKLILSKELYNEMFSKNVSEIAIQSNNPSASEEAISDSLTGGETIKSRYALMNEQKENKAGVIAGLTLAIAASILLTIIGISGNQVIGFIGRKKEYAMLHSCACDLASIIRMIWIENALLFGFSVLLAGILSIPVIRIISKIFVIAEMGLYATPNYALIVICLIVLWGITMLTALTPIRSLKKMNTAMEMKYE